MLFGVGSINSSAALRQDTVPAEAHNSMIVRLFCEDMAVRSRARVLDVGPICGENISLFAKGVQSLYVCDLFSGLHRERRAGQPLARFWKELEYAPDSFDGMLLWDLIDRVDDQETGRLLETVRGLLKPDGLLVVFACDEHEAGDTVEAFVLGRDYTVHQRPQGHLSLPRFPRQNREMLALLDGFDAVKSVIYRNGIREFLLRPV